MSWFTDLCRNMGLMIHNVRHPDDDANKGDEGETKETRLVRKEVEEEQVDEVTTLRRTTIEEIEIKKKPDRTKSDPSSDG